MDKEERDFKVYAEGDFAAAEELELGEAEGGEYFNKEIHKKFIYKYILNQKYYLVIDVVKDIYEGEENVLVKDISEGFNSLNKVEIVSKNDFLSYFRMDIVLSKKYKKALTLQEITFDIDKQRDEINRKKVKIDIESENYTQVYFHFLNLYNKKIKEIEKVVKINKEDE
jgi:hypothetical protein